MSYDEHDAAMDAMYDGMSEMLYPEHREQAIYEFIEERMLSYYLKHPRIISPPFGAFHHANELWQVSPTCALLMYTTSIELFLKSVLLKPVLAGMIHNEDIAEMIVDISTSQTGFSRYKKLLAALCYYAAEIRIKDIKGLRGRPILDEAEEIQGIRNKVVHQGYFVTEEEMGSAKNTCMLILDEMVEPVLGYLKLKIGGQGQDFEIVRA